MLTPDVVKSKVFQVSGRGAYRSDDVDTFFAEVSSSYEQMFRENGELIKKISILANKVEQYKEEEDSLRKALIAAQTLADKIVKDARESVAGTLEKAQADSDEMHAKAEAEAKEIVDNAKAEAEAVILQSKKDADEILGAVNRKVMKESLEFEMLQKKAAEFRANLLGLYKEHLHLINAIPEYVEKEMPESEAAVPEAETAPAAEPAAEETAASEAAEPEAQAPAAEEIAAEEAIEEPVEPEEVEEPAEPAEVEEIAEITFDSERAETAADTVAEVFEDIASSSESDEMSLFDADDGFSLDLSAFEDDDLLSEAPAEQESVSAAPARAYATIEETEAQADADDEDDDPGSFKSFFKKK